MPTGVQVKLLGWIKTAVGLVKIPADPRKVEPPHEPPHEAPPAIEGRATPDDVKVDSVRVDAIDTDTINTDTINTNAMRADAVDTDSPANRTASPSDAPPGIEISVEPESGTFVESESTPSQQEIDRRRAMVRAFFNDYWSSADDKPASFAERLDRAEGYINERVAAGGEAWRLGPGTRKQLGLPPSRKR
jgi:hypothetical protein